MRIAVVEMHGTISDKRTGLGMRSMGDIIDKAFRFAGKGGTVALDINSPGGSPVQSKLMADRVRRRAAETGAVVHACIADVGASGGYWLACAANVIHASPMSIIGSIGAIAGGFGFSDALDRFGVERRVHVAGSRKALMDPFLPESQEGAARMEVLLAGVHAEFVAWVKERRPRLVEADSGLFSGDVWHGRDAVRLGLVDDLADLDTVCRALGGENCKPRVFRPKGRLIGRLSLPGLRAGGEILADAAVTAIEARINPGIPIL